jgi:hypothetical protein
MSLAVELFDHLKGAYEGSVDDLQGHAAELAGRLAQAQRNGPPRGMDPAGWCEQVGRMTRDLAELEAGIEYVVNGELEPPPDQAEAIAVACLAGALRQDPDLLGKLAGRVASESRRTAQRLAQIDQWLSTAGKHFSRTRDEFPVFYRALQSHLAERNRLASEDAERAEALDRLQEALAPAIGLILTKATAAKLEAGIAEARALAGQLVDPSPDIPRLAAQLRGLDAELAKLGVLTRAGLVASELSDRRKVVAAELEAAKLAQGNAALAEARELIDRAKAGEPRAVGRLVCEIHNAPRCFPVEVGESLLSAVLDVLSSDASFWFRQLTAK